MHLGGNFTFHTRLIIFCTSHILFTLVSVILKTDIKFVWERRRLHTGDRNRMTFKWSFIITTLLFNYSIIVLKIMLMKYRKDRFSTSKVRNPVPMNKGSLFWHSWFLTKTCKKFLDGVCTVIYLISLLRMKPSFFSFFPYYFSNMLSLRQKSGSRSRTFRSFHF